MQLDDALSALALTDPPVREHGDDALLARILATPFAAPKARRRRRRLVVAAAGASVLVAVTAGWGYTNFIVDSKGLAPFLEQAREDVPLPPGAGWTPVTPNTLPPDSVTDGPSFARGAALLEAQCHWERFIVDGRGNAAQTAQGIAGLRSIATLMGENPGTAMGRPIVEGYADRAARGDLGGVRQDLAVNCPPAMGGTATPLNLLNLSLREAGTPAVAVILAYPGQRYVPDAEQARVNEVVRAVRVRLDAAGLSTDPAETGTGFWVTGQGVIMIQFHVSDPEAAATIAAQAFAGVAPGADSRVLVWKAPEDTRAIPLP
jgi:hypothetical protein